VASVAWLITVNGSLCTFAGPTTAPSAAVKRAWRVGGAHYVIDQLAQEIAAVLYDIVDVGVAGAVGIHHVEVMHTGIDKAAAPGRILDELLEQERIAPQQERFAKKP